MTDADLLTLAEREIQRLTDENDRSAAAIMRTLADRVRGRTTERIPAQPYVINVDCQGVTDERLAKFRAEMVREQEYQNENAWRRAT